MSGGQSMSICSSVDFPPGRPLNGDRRPREW
jgi:hypothetical protein